LIYGFFGSNIKREMSKEHDGGLLLGAVNLELVKALEDWWMDPSEGVNIVRINTFIHLAENADLDVVVRIQRKPKSDFVDALPFISHGEDGVMVCRFSPGGRPPERAGEIFTPIVYVDRESMSSSLVIFQKSDGVVVRFAPQEVCSIEIQEREKVNNAFDEDGDVHNYRPSVSNHDDGEDFIDQVR
jgi:hypothetical protein